MTETSSFRKGDKVWVQLPPSWGWRIAEYGREIKRGRLKGRHEVYVFVATSDPYPGEQEVKWGVMRKKRVERVFKDANL